MTVKIFKFYEMEKIHRKLAILPLHRKSRVLGPRRAGGRQRVNFDILVAGCWLHLSR